MGRTWGWGKNVRIGQQPLIVPFPSFTHSHSPQPYNYALSPAPITPRFSRISKGHTHEHVGRLRHWEELNDFYTDIKSGKADVDIPQPPLLSCDFFELPGKDLWSQAFLRSKRVREENWNWFPIADLKAKGVLLMTSHISSKSDSWFFKNLHLEVW